MTLSAAEANQVKKAQAVEGVLPAILNRWSPRSYTDREVSRELLAKVFEAAHWAASSYNEQPWRYIVGLRGDAAYEKIYGLLGDFNKAWAGKAPVLIFGAASTKFSHNGSDNASALYDLGAASSYLTLQASALGLATHQMAGYDRAAAHGVLGIPQDYVLGAVIALGYQGEPADLPQEQMRSQEVAPRTRKPLSEFVFSSWGHGAKLG